MIPDPEPSEIALPTETNPVRDEAFENSAFDSAVDLMVEEEEGEFSTQPDMPVPVISTNDPLISLEDAAARLGSEVVETLKERFNGKLTEVRRVDALDRIF